MKNYCLALCEILTKDKIADLQNREVRLLVNQIHHGLLKVDTSYLITRQIDSCFIVVLYCFQTRIKINRL